MSLSTNTLIVCRDISDFKRLNSFKKYSDRRYILASDSISLHKNCKKINWIDSDVWLEDSRSSFSVLNEVLKLIDSVNLFLKNISENDSLGLPQNLFYWIYHVEGGKTTQSIQDSVLLIESYSRLFKENDIIEVIIIGNRKFYFENMILIETAKKLNIKATLIDFFYIKMFSAFLFDIIKYSIKNMVHSVAVTSYLMKKNFFAILKKQMFDENKEKFEILFQLCGNAKKHQENIIPIMKELNKIGYESIALCWRAKLAAKYLTEVEKLKVAELEYLIPFGTLIKTCFYSLITIFKLKKIYTRFSEFPEINYNGVKLDRILMRGIIFFLFSEIPMRYKFDCAVKKYFLTHHPVAVKLWGGGYVMEGSLLNDNIEKLPPNSMPARLYWFWLIGGPVHSRNISYVDLFLTAGDIQKKYLIDLGIPENRIKLTGMFRYTDLSGFKNKYSVDDSKTILNIKNKYKLNITYDLSNSARGNQSVFEQIQILEFLFGFAKNNPEISLIIKPHPYCNVEDYLSLFNEYNLSNFYLIDKTTLPYHCLNFADVFITKISTMGLESMLFEKPILIILLDNEKNWRLYEDAAEYFYSTDECGNFLKKILADEEFKKKWTDETVRKQKKFLKRFFGIKTENAAAAGAAAIDDYLNQKVEKGKKYDY
ncbi:hypothetical protein KA977_06240 [Candidatus Dependentiae bacterium]|nr:hypothetical protein [Candidatus Dependentiae bacterium]